MADDGQRAGVRSVVGIWHSSFNEGGQRTLFKGDAVVTDVLKIRILGIVFLWAVIATVWARPVVANATESTDAASVEKAKWYVVRKGAVHGPYTETRMDTFIGNGTVTPKTLVRAANWDQWRRADQAFDAFKHEKPPAPAISWQPKDVTLNEAILIRPRITSAKHLAALGVGLWTVGKLLQVAGVAMMAGMMSDESGLAGAFVFMAGSGIGVLSPIPAVIAENRVNRVLSRTSAGRINSKDRMIPAGAFYGVGLGLAAAGTVGLFTDVGQLSLWVILAAEISLAFANFSALHRIRRFERRNFGRFTVTPQIQKGLVGLSVGSSF